MSSSQPQGATPRVQTVSFAVTIQEKTWLQDQAKRRGVPVAKMVRDEVLRAYFTEKWLKAIDADVLRAQRAAEEVRRLAREFRRAAAKAGAAGQPRVNTPGRVAVFVCATDAEQWVRDFAGTEPGEPIPTVFRRAYLRAHPDRGGQRSDWESLDKARRLLLPDRY